MKNNRPLVTIAIPTYNRAEKNLPKALNSALAQTYNNIEVIVSDNCSTDNTEELIKGYLSDDRIKYIRQEINLGANGNFNDCLARAKGQYFLLLHDDDLIDKDFVDCCMKKINYAGDYGIIRTGTRLIDVEGQTIQEYVNDVAGLSTIDFYIGWFTYKTSWYLCSTIFNTEALKKIGGFRSKHNLLEDGYAIVKILSFMKREDVYDVKASFRFHDNQATFAAEVEDWCDDFYGLLELMLEQVPENNMSFNKEANRFFAMLCRKRIKMVKSPFKKIKGYLAIRKYFGIQNMLAK